MILQDVLLIVIMISTVLLETFMIGILCMIGRFYQLKFGQRTYYYLFALPFVTFLIMVILVRFFGLNNHASALVTNLISFIVLAVVGRSLYKKMTGVSH